MPVKSKPINTALLTNVIRKRMKKKTVKLGNGCILWVGYKTREGYGQIWVGDRAHLAHRVAYVLAYGNTPEDEVLDHLCRNRGCVNPEHLESVSPLVNVQRGFEAITECPRGHSLNEENNIIFRNKRLNGRGCRACDNGLRRVRSLRASGLKISDADIQAIVDEYYARYTKKNN